MNTKLLAAAVKKWLVDKAINDSLPLDMNDISESELQDVMDSALEPPVIKSRKSHISKIFSIASKRSGNIIPKDYGCSMSIDDCQVEEIGTGYIIFEDGEDMDFDDLTDEQIEEIFEIIEQVEIADEKTMKRCEN
jgi:hypothetical protein